MSFAFPWSSNRTTRTGLRLAALCFIIALVGMSVATAATLSPATQNVSNDPDVASNWPEVAQAPNGDIHVVWDSPETGRQVRYAKGVWNGENYSFGPSHLVGSGEATRAFPSVAVAPNGNIMVAWSDSAKTINFRVWNSADAAPGGVTVNLGEGIHPTITPDAQSDFHIAWSGNFDVQYREFSPTQGIIANDVFGVQVNSPPDLAVDTGNNVHVVWQGEGQFVRYASRTAGAAKFGSPVGIGGSGAVLPQIAADGLGNVHIVRSEGGDIIYCRKTINSGCGDSRPIATSLADNRPSIGATRSGGVFIAFIGGNSLWYDAFENGAWQGTKEVQGASGTHLDVSTRPYSSRVSIVWNQGFDIQHRWARVTPGVVCGAGESVTDEPVTAAATYKLYLPMVSKFVPPPPPEC